MRSTANAIRVFRANHARTAAAFALLFTVTASAACAQVQSEREPVPDPLTQRLVIYGRHDVDLSVFDEDRRPLGGADLIVTHRPTGSVTILRTDQSGVAKRPGQYHYDPSLQGPGNIGFVGGGEKIEIVVSHPRYPAELREIAPYRVDPQPRPRPRRFAYGLVMGLVGEDGGKSPQIGDREWRIVSGPTERPCKRPECPLISCATMRCGAFASRHRIQIGTGASASWERTIAGKLSAGAAAQLGVFSVNIKGEVSGSRVESTKIDLTTTVDCEVGGSAGQVLPGFAGQSGNWCLRRQIVSLTLQEFVYEQVPAVFDESQPTRPVYRWRGTPNRDVIEMPVGLCDDLSDIERDPRCPQPQAGDGR